MSEQDKLAALKAEIENLKRELQIAVSECCNAYFWNGHFDRVSSLYGIRQEEPET
jgi:hypothetical protein